MGAYRSASTQFSPCVFELSVMHPRNRRLRSAVVDVEHTCVCMDVQTCVNSWQTSWDASMPDWTVTSPCSATSTSSTANAPRSSWNTRAASTNWSARLPPNTRPNGSRTYREPTNFFFFVFTPSITLYHFFVFSMIPSVLHPRQQDYVFTLVCCVVSLFLSYRSDFKSNLHQTFYAGRHWLFFGESRSKVNQDIGQLSKIQYCEIGLYRSSP